MGFQGDALLPPRPNPKLEDHPLSAARDCLFKKLSYFLLISSEHPKSSQQ